nr:proline/glycine betaine ABC transporter permease [Prosthecochloris sp. ZM_2]
MEQQLRTMLDIGGWFEIVINWLTANFDGLFDAIRELVNAVLVSFQGILTFPHPYIMVGLFAALAFWRAGIGIGIFTLLGMFLIHIMGFWEVTMDTLALVITSVVIALVIGVPVGILAAKSDLAERIVRPVLDFMQTLPAFVYLIPAVLFFQLGAVPGVIATLIFSLPPAVRLTSLGIRQVPKEIREAATSFGSTPRQMLFKAELPVALPTIMAGVNQTIMLALSMVVIAGMIGAGGLGNEVLKGITQLKIGLGFESGISIVILAIFLDRVTQSLANPKGRKS